ncbi:3'(2'),5'-bisphosphate nucleotidase CysQ, partial [Mesorhizobium sp. M4A.F.Ca.ET.029.04.2.1]
MPKTNMTAAAASEDEAMLGVFERLALDAGREVMRVFHAGCAIDRKSDSTPVTEADRESEKIILAGLRAAYPDIPCVAEEEVAAGVATPDLDD